MAFLPNVAEIRHETPAPAPAGEPRDRRGVWLAAGWTAFIAAGATAAAVMGHQTGIPLAFAIITLVVMTVPYLLTLFGPGIHGVRALLARSPWSLAGVVLAFVAAYVFYGIGTGTFTWLASLRIAAFAGIPAVLAASARQRPGVVWQDFAIVACIWLPFNFGLLDSIWEWPAGQAAYILNTPMAVDLAIALFLGWRRVPQLPLRWQVSAADLWLVARVLAVFMIIAMPIGFATGFLEVHPKIEVAQLLGQPFGIFFFIAIPEELLFRGLLQGLLIRRTGRPLLSLVIASVLFGCSHWHTIDKFMDAWRAGVPLLSNPGLPDPRYIGLAALAGLFYGYTYLRSRSLAVPALLHAAVDTIWALLLHT